MSPLKSQLLTLARYNAWATNRLLDGHVAALPEADYRRDLGLFFKSVHGTLNHLLVGEQLLWWRRFSEGVSPSVPLDSEAEADRAALAQRLKQGADRWTGWLEQLPEDRLHSTLHYTTMRGTPAALPFAATLAHVFNHGTHHRGQITAALTALGRPCPEIDLVYMLQAESQPA
jgi:uncharacterized damage-inducible protein DinB